MPQVTDVTPIAAALTALTLGTPMRHSALTVIPLRGAACAEPGWLTLAEAGDAVTIAEVSEAGSVPTLTVTNSADRPVLLIDGEELIGAKQNRSLNTTVLIAAHSTAAIPVSCVEQGRWSYRSRRFTSSEYWLYASIRRMKAARVSDSVRRRGRHDSDQREVWDELAGKAASLRVDSPTGAMHAVYDRYADALAAGREALAPAPGQTGVIVYVAGTWAGLEMLETPALFARAWPRISMGYLADALGQPPADELRIVPGEVVASVMSATAEPAPPLGLGLEYRLGGERVVGAALVVDDSVAHLIAFPGVVD
jgi:hypothetical protein